MTYLALSLYEFADWTEAFARDACARAESLAAARGVVGLCVIGREGLNCSCAGEAAAARAFADDLRSAFGLTLDNVKESWSETLPFGKFRAPYRTEIVTLGDPETRSDSRAGRATPEEFHALLSSPDVAVLDTRNWYETKLGKFRGAVELGLDEFQEFAERLPQAEIPKDKTVLIYCTGGIRCEKAIVEMQKQGFSDVRQLDGGILRYLELYPRDGFDGECFVFDRRLAVDQNLAPTERWRQCPHCGQPASRAPEAQLNCVRCGTEASVCETCHAQDDLRTCSKNCAHHWRLAPGKKGRPQIAVLA